MTTPNWKNRCDRIWLDDQGWHAILAAGWVTRERSKLVHAQSMRSLSARVRAAVLEAAA